MDCGNCNNECVLIKQDCFCVMQPNAGLQLTHLGYIVGLVNCSLSGLVGDACFECLCAEELDVIRQHPTFKRWYAFEIYFVNFCITGLSKSAKNGEVTFQGEEDYYSQSSAEIKRWEKKKCELEVLRDMLKGKLVKLFNKLKPECMECDKNICPNCECDCGGTCEINKIDSWCTF